MILIPSVTIAARFGSFPISCRSHTFLSQPVSGPTEIDHGRVPENTMSVLHPDMYPILGPVAW